MKKFTVIALIAAAALALTPKPAVAGGDKAIAAIGGFIGGVIVGSAMERDHHAPYAREYSHSRVIIDDRRDRCDDGYWRDVRVRMWVPACWSTSYDCGRRVRVFIPGHYEFRTDRVWVDNGPRGRGYGYGYGYGRR